METKMEKKLDDLLQEADWKEEKHVPAIDCPNEVSRNELFEVNVGLGKEISHPNTTEHHIKWIELYFLPENEKFPYQIGRYEFNAHGASTDGADTSTVYTHHNVKTEFKTGKPGSILAMAYCNIHGLWQSSKPIGLK